MPLPAISRSIKCCATRSTNCKPRKSKPRPATCGWEYVYIYWAGTTGPLKFALADGGALAHFFLAKSLFAREEYAAAIECYQAAEKAGYDVGECSLGHAEALRYAGKATESLAVLDRLSGAIEQTADYLASGRPRYRPWAATHSKSSPFTNGPWNPTAIIPGHCSAWPWKTIATATTIRPWNCTNGPWAGFPPTSGRS